MPHKQSYITVTDQFCGAGGSSLGAQSVGVEIKLALNHWKLAIETHNSNFPDTYHECTDISACDPRRYPSTDILITSPECTNHSIAKGRKRAHYQADLFGNVLIDPSEERSRATMWDVPRFAEYHKYNFVIVENVVDARHWVLWDAWLHAMELLGYEHRCVFYNSQFAHPTPQSRDRMYVVFWKKGNPAPNLEISPAAWCFHCEKEIAAMQTWKNGARQFGRYGKNGQYIYTCPECRLEVRPFYYPALTAIDWSLPVQRIGDRVKPLKERTLQRIRLGLERFANQHILTDILYSHAHGAMARPITDALQTQTAQQSLALIKVPFVGVQRTHGTPRGIDEELQTIVTDNQHFLIQPQIVELRNHQNTSLVSEPLKTISAGGIHAGLLVPFLASYYGTQSVRPVDEPAGTITGTDRHSLVMPFVLNQSYGTGYKQPERPVTDPLPTMTGIVGHQLVIPMPFISSQYNGEHRNAVHAVDESLPTVPGMAVHYIAQPGEVPSVEDCGFRMLEPHEIQAAMAFPDDYKVIGNKRQRVKQLGNAVTPPVMKLLVERCVASLAA